MRTTETRTDTPGLVQRMVRRLVFWVSYVPIGGVIIITSCLAGLFHDVSEWVDDKSSKWERWCMRRDETNRAKPPNDKTHR